MTPEAVLTFSILAPLHVLTSSSQGRFEEIVVTTLQGRAFLVAAVWLASPRVPRMLWQLLTPVHRTLHVSNSRLSRVKMFYPVQLTESPLQSEIVEWMDDEWLRG